MTEITIYGRPSSEALEHGFLGLTTGFLLRPIIDTLSVQKHNLHFGLVSYIIYHLFVLNPPVLPCHLRVSGSSARSLSDVFRLAFNIGFVFSHSLSFCLSPCHRNVHWQLRTSRRRKDRTKTGFFFFFYILQAVALHWHTGVDCIFSPMQTRCEAVKYGSTFVFKGRRM